jgi:hypothetical protein
VTIFATEDNPLDTVRPQLAAAGADLGRIVSDLGADRLDEILPQGRPVELDRRLNGIGKSTNLVLSAGLIVVESAYLGINLVRTGQTRATFDELADTAEMHQVAILLVHALDKSENKSRIYEAVERVATAWLVVPDKDVPSRRLWLPIKDQASTNTTGLAFTIRAEGSLPRIAWEEVPHTVTAKAALEHRDRTLNELARREAPALPRPTSGPPYSHQPKTLPEGPNLWFPEHKRNSAMAWLEKVLANGSMPSKEVMRLAITANYKWMTVRRAQMALGIKPFRRGFGPRGVWCWGLPHPTAPEPE